MTSQAIQHLVNEHQEAKTFLNVLELHLKEIRSDEHSDLREASALLEYLSELFFVKHEEKEETILLPELFRERRLTDTSQIRLLREQHQRGQTLLNTLWKALRPGEVWGPGQREHFLASADRWIHYIRGHLKYEEAHLFPLLEEQLDPELDAFMLREFEKVEEEYRGLPDALRLRAVADEFVERTLARLSLLANGPEVMDMGRLDQDQVR